MKSEVSEIGPCKYSLKIEIEVEKVRDTVDESCGMAEIMYPGDQDCLPWTGLRELVKEIDEAIATPVPAEKS